MAQKMPLHRQCLVDAVGQGQGLGSEAAELDIVTVDAVEIEQSQGRPDDVQPCRSCALFSLLLPLPMPKARQRAFGRWSRIGFRLVHDGLGDGAATILSSSARPRCSAFSQVPSPRRIKRVWG